MVKSRFLIIIGIHGNEYFSIPILKRLEKTYDPNIYGYDWIVGNPLAVSKKVRYVDVDLNRCAPGDLNSDKYESRRAAEIISICKKYRFVIDIHGAISNCGVCTIVTNPTRDTITLASNISCQNNIVWENESKLETGPVTKYLKCPAIEIECGPMSAKSTNIQLFDLLSKLISSMGSFVAGNVSPMKWYRVVGRSTCADNAKDFSSIRHGKGKYFSFLCNQYAKNECIKLEKVTFDTAISPG